MQHLWVELDIVAAHFQPHLARSPIAHRLQEDRSSRMASLLVDSPVPYKAFSPLWGVLHSATSGHDSLLRDAMMSYDHVPAARPIKILPPE